MAIENDFTVYPYSKVIRHTGTNDNVYSVAAFYSFLQDLFDEPGYMSYEKPIKYNTPTSYTMLNGWFLDNGDESNILEFLYGGSIDTTGYTDDVVMVDLDDDGANYVACVASDKDLPVTAAATLVGPLLAYKNNYPVTDTGRIWIRDTEAHAAITDGDNIDVTGGTGGGWAAEAEQSGDEIYTNIYTIASFVGTPDPQVYIKQSHPVDTTANPTSDVRIAEWSNTDSWDRGSIDVIIPVKLGGNLINSGLVNVYVRQTGDTFTHVADVDLSAGSRTPVATETSADTVNITVGEHYMIYDGGSGPGDFSIGDIIQDVSTTSLTPPTWYAEVVAVDEFASTTEGLLTLRALRGTPANNDDIYVGTSVKGVVYGSVGDTYGTWDSQTSAPVEGDWGKIMLGGSTGAKRLLRSFDTTEKYWVAQVDDSLTGSNRDAYYVAYNATETLSCTGDGGTMNVTSNLASTTLISGFSDVTIAHINGTITTGASYTGTFKIGETLSFSPSGATAVLVKADSLTAPTSMTLANVSTTEPTESDSITGDSSGATCECDSTMTDAYKAGFEFPLQSEGAEYSVFIQGGDVYNAGRSLTDIYAYLQYKCRDGESDVFYTSDGSTITQVQGQFYIKAYSTYSAVKVAPFGTLAGGVFFGARGVGVEGMSASDDNNIKLTDDANNAQEPYTSVTVTVSNTRVSDVITVFLEDGSTGLPDKAQYTCAASQLQGDSDLTNNGGTFPNDTPSSGWVYVVDNTNNEEHKYRYTSWTSDTLTLATKVTGTDEGTGGFTQIDDTGSFTNAQRGDIIRNTTNSGFSYITEVTSNDSVKVTVNSDGYTWQSANFEMNTLVQNYGTGDTFFIPYLEDIEDTGTDGSPGSKDVSLTYVSDRSVVIRVRNVLNATPIQPFVTTSNILNSGMTVSVIRTEDEVYA